MNPGVTNPTIFLKIGFAEVLDFLGISKMDILSDAENTVYDSALR